MNDEQLRDELVSKMNKKEKAAYIWEYYKMHIIGGIIGVLVILSFIYIWFINPPAGTYCGVAVYNAKIEDTMNDDISHRITSAVVQPDENKEVVISCFYESETDPTVAVEMGQKFEMMMISKEIDILMANEDAFKNFVDQGYIINIDEVLTEEELSEFDDIYKSGNSQDSTIRPYGISVNSSKYFSNINGIKKYGDFYIGIIRHSKRAEEAEKTLREIMSIE